VTRTTYAFALLAAVAALAIAGCGGGSSSSESSNSEAAGGSSNGGGKSVSSSPSGSGSGMAITGASVSGLGTVLVDSEGLTVYEFAKDKGTSSSCYGECAEGWPPVITEGAPSAGEGAMASQLGTTKRKDGTLQVTYAGHPLYTFVEDEGPGEANGNGSEAFGGTWSALDESGAAVEGSASGEAEESEESSESSSGGGYGY
jgi:predicted lipoprotein with Yx(FWY)xxD motif